MFFIAAALVLTTAGVFAGKARFANFQLYASNTGFATTSFAISPAAASLVGFSTTGTTQSLIYDQSSVSYDVYYYDGSSNTLHPLYATGW